jgi:SNF2 family DNA or RNA helicase
MAVIQTFRRGELPAVMGHPETISLGLDGLQDSCHNICWYGLPWNLLHYLQTIDRVRRQGSRSNTVTLHRIIARGTIDEDVLEVLDKKDADQSDFLKLLGKLTQSSVV